MKTLLPVLALLITCSALLSACATDEHTSCTPGIQLACTCTNGAAGSQVCLASGGFTECSCMSNADAGTEDAEVSSMDAAMDAAMSDAGNNADLSVDSGAPVDALRRLDAVTSDGTFAICISVSDCNDGDACTTDSCVLGECTYTPISCDDENPCTVDQCDNEHAGCFYSPWCDDDISCTSDSCETSSGGLTTCDHTPVNSSCNDGVSCTIDSCSPTLGCIHFDNC